MFSYYMPTKVIAGVDVVKQNRSNLLIGTKAMIVTGKTSGMRSGALQDVTELLDEHHIPYLIYDCIENNPSIESTVEGGKVAREFGADFLIGIGGGSPLDACKAIAVYAMNEPISGSSFDVYDIFKGSYPNKPLPMVAIPTTAGTGSEVTQYAILTLHDEKNKRSFTSPDVFYRTAFLDGRYMMNLPLQIARNTAIDAISHLIESYTVSGSSPASEYMALEGLRQMGKQLDNLKNGSLDVESCTNLLWAACLGGCVIAQTGVTIVHSMGYPLTYYKDIPHGMANGWLLTTYMEQVQNIMPQKIEACLHALGLNTIDEFQMVLDGLLPKPISVTEDELTAWVKTTIQAKNVKSCPFPVTEDLEVELYHKALLRD